MKSEDVGDIMPDANSKWWKEYCNRLTKIIRRINLKKLGIAQEKFTEEEIDKIVNNIYKDMNHAGITTKEAEESLRNAFAEIQNSKLLND